MNEPDEFAICETVAEVLVVVHAQFGLAGVEHLIDMCRADLDRKTLQDAAAAFRRVGLSALADLVLQHAKRAKKRRKAFNVRWRQKPDGMLVRIGSRITRPIEQMAR